MSCNKKRNSYSRSLSDQPNEKVDTENSLVSNTDTDTLNGDGQEYTREQLNELREYLSMIADLVIEIYYDEQN